MANKPFRFGRKLFFALLLSVAGGFGWAMHETKTPPDRIVQAFKALLDGSPLGGTPEVEESPSPTPVVSTSATPKPTKTASPKPTASAAPEVVAAFEEIEKLLQAGKVTEAQEHLAKTDRSALSAKVRQTYDNTAARLDRLAALLRETTPGRLAEMPEIGQVYITGGGVEGILVRNVSETPAEYRFDTLDGIRSKAKKSEALYEKLGKALAEAALDRELERRAVPMGIRLFWEQSSLGRAMKFEHVPGIRVQGIHYFELADFCARNGVGRRLVPLLEKAVELDATVAQTVHEGRADSMVDALIYYISIRAREDAKKSFATLEERYATTAAYRDRLLGDPDLRKHYETLFERPLAAKPPPSPTPSLKPGPSPTATSDPIASPIPLTPTPSVDPEPTEDPGDRSVADGADSGPVVLPPEAPAKAKELCLKGDEAYAKAGEHLVKANPVSNPRGWSSENYKALELLNTAFEHYAAAQDLFPKQVPDSLLKRFRDVQATRSICRKRSVSKR